MASYTLNPSTNSYPLDFYSQSTPWDGMKYKNTPEDRARYQSDLALKQAGQTATGISRDRAEYAGNVDRYGGALDSMYMDMANGGWGMTPEQRDQYLDLDNLNASFDPARQMNQWQSDIGGLRDAYSTGATDTRGAARDYINSLQAGVDPVAGYDARLDSNLANMWQRGDSIYGTMSDDIRGSIDNMRSNATASGPWTSGGGLALYGIGGGGSYSGSSVNPGGAASVEGVDLSGLNLDPEFLAKYKMTPEQIQQLVNLQAQGAGGRYRSALDDSRRAMAQAGVANPYAEAAMRDRFERQEGIALDDARLAAQVTGDNTAASRLMDIENLRSGNERQRASILASIAQTNAQLQDSAAGRAYSASESAANRELQARLAAAQTAAQMEQFYKQLGFNTEQAATAAYGNLGATGLGWTQYGTDTTLGALADRERDLSSRLTHVADAGYGANLQNEQNLMNANMNMNANIATGTQGVMDNIAKTGLDYSNTRSERYGNVFDNDNALKAAGVSGIQGLYDSNLDARQNTWNQTNQALQGGTNTALQGTAVLGNYKNNKNPGFWDSFKGSLGTSLGAGLGKGIVGAGG